MTAVSTIPPGRVALCTGLVVIGLGCAGPEPPPEAPGSSEPVADTVTSTSSGRLAVPAGEPSIRGIVTEVSGESVRIEADPAAASGSAKAVARVGAGTRVLYRGGEPASLADLTIGHNVSVWFTGPVMESYPVQAAAETIVIEPVGSI